MPKFKVVKKRYREKVCFIDYLIKVVVFKIFFIYSLLTLKYHLKQQKYSHEIQCIGFSQGHHFTRIIPTTYDFQINLKCQFSH